ncbi:hypothetical protein [Phaeobacter inhibens]|uniref:Uncharacterized protein n=1 Tax=Phaeobacter inhibens TaxID=221822 RepID=A0A2I7KAX8_9RHOB|nr:hypothetical protein [Phaeobacter inhibens]AUQ99742.1 hypothetical protein PhaeoP88_02387 [Phaeobacter inhibens]
MKLSHKTQWLENLPLSTLQTLMARYALRAFPAIVQRYESTTFHEDHFLKHARSLLSAVCLIAKPSEELRIAAVFAAANARQAGHDVGHSAASLAAVAAARSLVLRRGDEAKHEILSSIETLPFSDFAEQAQWDYGKISSASENPAISHSPLWTIELQHFEAARQIDTPNDRKLQKRLSFWREWYQGFLDGKPLDWELQRRVALIDDTIWDAGPETVAAEIERIEAEFLAEKLPMAETIELHPETGKFRAVPILVENASYMSALLTQIGDALEDCLGEHNGLSDRSGDVKKLNRVLTKYKDDPQNAELTLTTVAGSLRRQLIETRELPPNEDNLALLNAVEEGVRGIRANHPEVAANRDHLAQQAFKALAPEDKQVLEEALPMLTAISEPELAEEFAQDIPELINDALLPLPDGAPPLPGADAATRVFSRSSKMVPLWEKLNAAHDGKVHRIATMGLAAYAVSELLFKMVSLGLRLLGVL